MANGLQPLLTGSPAQFTQHAFLIACGEFAHEIGLVQKLQQVAIPQKDVIHLSQVLSLVNSCRAMSHKVVPVRLVASIISRHADGEKGKAN
jgi:hypothetical protein